jgi:ABC-type transport system involved in multi-copper enzyme maturation permease subunit
MLGPHFYYDLIRLARHRRNVFLRCGYLIALMIAWWIVYERSLPFAGQINDYARLAENFAYSLIALQYVMILLLAPIYLAGTITEERESRTLELVFQTQLSDREILLGKFAARVVHLIFMMLLPLPMLAIITLWGGVDMEVLSVHFTLMFILILFVGSVCLWASVSQRRYTESMMLAYSLEFVFGYYGGILVGAALDRAGAVRAPPWWAVAALTAAALGGTLFFLWIALRQLTKLRDLNWVKRVNPPPPPQPRERRPRRPRVKPMATPTREVRGHALLWKETDRLRFVQLPPVVAWIDLGCVATLGLFHVVICWLEPAHLVRNDLFVLQFICVMGYVCAVGATFLFQSLQSTAGVASERERNTLDFLLLLPIERSEILWTKWLAPWIQNRVYVFVTLAIPLVCIFFGVLPLRTGLVMLLLPWPTLLFVSALGLLLSVVCRRVVMANVWLVGIVVFVFAVHLLFLAEIGLMIRGLALLLVGSENGPAMDPEEFVWAQRLLVGQQALLLLSALGCLLVAFRKFAQRTEEVRVQGG